MTCSIGTSVNIRRVVCRGEPKGLIERMWGVGRHLWVGVNADEYVNDLRKDWGPRIRGNEW